MENKAWIELIEKGHKNCEIVKMTGFPKGTVRNFKRQKSEIKANLGEWVLQKSVLVAMLMNYSVSNRLVAMMEFYFEK